MSDQAYVLESSDHERLRLMKQGDALAEATERLFKSAGIAPGMRVLDVGSGAGDVAILARHFVGKSGEVIGVDSDPEQVAFANHRALSLGYANVGFVTTDYPSLLLERSVDAVVGRLVLLHASDPAGSLASVCRNLRTGGVVAFLECNIQYDAPVLVEPSDGLAGRAMNWINSGLKHSGVQPRLGLKLFAVMKAAGLEPSPEIIGTLNVSQGPDGRLFPSVVSLVRSAMTSIIASGAATEAEIDIDTLEQRLIADAPSTGVLGTISAGFVGVWARKP
jgi:SAM-dependent methyltransferase